jgi:hypothetical protein
MYLSVVRAIWRDPRLLAREQEGKVGRMRKLRRAAETAVTAVETAGELRFCLSQRACIEGGGRCRGFRRCVGERLAQFGGLGGYVVAAIFEGFRHALAKVGEPGQAVARFLREIGSAEKGRTVGREEHSQRPAAAATGQHLVGGLVDLVEIGALLPVDLDVDKKAVHHRRHALVLEGLVGHDVAPVAGRITYRQQDRPVLPAGQSERLLVPGLPVHRIVGVL